MGLNSNWESGLICKKAAMDNISVTKTNNIMKGFLLLFSFVNRMNHTFYVFIVAAVLLTGSFSNAALAQSNNGNITGTVTTGDGVDISKYVILLEETGEVAPIKKNGVYVFEEVSAGNYTLVFRTTDEVIEEASLTVESGESIEQDFELAQSSSSEESNEKLTVRQAAGFGNNSVEEALARLPGVQVTQDGRINIRGAGYKSYYVTVDGQRMGTTGLGDRSAELGAISVDLIQEAELIKVLTPDMDADGLAGAVNLKAYKAKAETQEFNAGFGGGANPQYFDRTGATGRAWIQFSMPLSEKISLSVNGNYQQVQNAAERLNIGYGVADFGNGDVDIMEEISPVLQTETRERLGGSFHLNYEASDILSFYLQAMVNTDERERVSHRTTWSGNESWTDQNTTGIQGRYNYDLNYEPTNIRQFTFQAGGKHLFENFVLEYDAGWAQSDIRRNSYRFPFQATGFQYTVDFEDRKRPTPQPVDEFPVADDLTLNEMTYIVDHHLDTKFSGRIDLEIPFDAGIFKVGSSALSTQKDANDRGAFSEYLYTYRGFLNLNGFEQHDAGAASVLKDYSVDWTLDTDEAFSFFEASIPNMRLDTEELYRRSNIWNYLGSENVYAAYGMADVEFGNLRIIGGLRVEHTTTDYQGRKVNFNRFGQFEESVDTSAVNNYTNLFPHVQLAFQPTESNNIRLAYSRTISRPDFNLISPFELLTPIDTTIFRGNPGLEPIVSDNLDLFVDHNKNGGIISAGAFYKRLTNFIADQEREIQISEGDHRFFDDFFSEEVTSISAHERSYQNADKTASIFGVEIGLQQRFTFLPGALSNLGTYLNYTWSNSVYESNRGEETTFLGQSPHVANAAVDYTVDRFSAQLSYHWTAEALDQLERSPRNAPATGSEQVYFDRYQPGYQDLSASVSFQVTDRLQLWANVYNLLRSEQVGYAYDRQSYPTSIYKREGIEFNAGVQLSL